MYEGIQKTVEENVPLIKESEYRRRWWNKDLENLVKEKTNIQKIANRWKAFPQHEIHEQARKIRNKFAEEINKAKRHTWDSFLEEIDSQNIYFASKMVLSEGTDGTRQRILTLKTGNGEGEEVQDSTNRDKAKRLYEQFFKKNQHGDKWTYPIDPDTSRSSTSSPSARIN